jgi:hypothetical protein
MALREATATTAFAAVIAGRLDWRAAARGS